jgi:NTE family protein
LQQTHFLIVFVIFSLAAKVEIMVTKHRALANAKNVKQHIAAYDMVALVLQGGGALGSYQAGVFEALTEAGIQPYWVSGVSIGAINAAIISGNRPENQVSKLKEFWDMVTSHGYASHLSSSSALRELHNMTSAWLTMLHGIPGFFKPRTINPWFQKIGEDGASSFYDTMELYEHLNELVDWDVLNNKQHRMSVGAVNVATGNFRYFDTELERIGPEHVMASGALPPAFPAVKIGKDHYWDGGIVSNTPLQYLLEQHKLHDSLVFQVDLFNARGTLPKSIPEVQARHKDIMYSSRTRNTTDRFKQHHNLQIKLRNALLRIDPKKRTADDHEMLAQLEEIPQINVLQLIYHHKEYEGDNKDYEFSKLTMQEHWAAGLEDTRRTLAHADWFVKPHGLQGLTAHDVHREENDDSSVL